MTEQTNGADILLPQGVDEQTAQRMVFTVNAIVSEEAYGWKRSLTDRAEWRWTDQDGVEYDAPKNLVESGEIVGAVESLVEQNQLVLGITYGAHHGGWEVFLKQGATEVGHVAGRPLHLMLGILLMTAVGKAPQAELERLFPILTPQ